MKKNILGAVIGMGMILVAVVPAFAAVDCENNTTGPDSWNVCGRISARLNRVRTNNLGTVIQNVTSTANTGGNKSNDNTVGAEVLNSVNSGSAAVTGLKGVQLNTTDVLVDQTSSSGCDTCTMGTGSNYITGPDSKNIIVSVDVKVASVETNNSGTVIQNVRSRANSGNNTVNHNTLAGGIATGNATVGEEVTTNLNWTMVTVNQ